MATTKRGNFTDRRGNGAVPRRMVISARDGKALHALMEQRHNYSAVEAVSALLSGEVKTVLLPDEELWALINWLEMQIVDSELLQEAIASLALQLRQ